MLARLTLNLEERLALYKLLEKNKHEIKGDERLILDVYIALTKYTNLRDQKGSQTKEALQEVFKLYEKHFGYVVHKYPQEIYLKSEYIEVLHALYGAETVLDSLNFLTSNSQKSNPFSWDTKRF